MEVGVHSFPSLSDSGGPLPILVAKSRMFPRPAIGHLNVLILMTKLCLPALVIFALPLLSCSTTPTAVLPAVATIQPATLDAVERAYALHPENQDRFRESVLRLMVAPDPEAQLLYDPSLTTLLAGLESKSYRRNDRQWKKTPLDPNGTPVAFRYYARSVTTWVRKGNRDDRVFVILGSSYSTWKRGTWTNKTSVILKRCFPDASIMVMPGFLTPEVLSARPLIPELDGTLVARDLYRRMRYHFERNWARLPEVGLIGYSGGGALALSLLAEDETYAAEHGKTRLFRLGGIAYSPVLDPLAAFEVLDAGSRWADSNGYSSRKAITTPVIPDLLFAALKNRGPWNLDYYARYLLDTPEMAEARRDLRARFYREFALVDLRGVIDAHYQISPAEVCPVTNHQKFYRDIVFPLHQQIVPELVGSRTIEEYASLPHTLRGLRSSRAYIVFPLDDPVLSCAQTNGEIVPHPRVIAALDWLKTLPNVRVFAPERGGHMGYFLDAQFLERCMAVFFGQD